MNRKGGLLAVLVVAVLLAFSTYRAIGQTWTFGNSEPTTYGATGQTWTFTSSASPTSRTTPSPVVELTKALAWPIAALLIAGIFRRPIGTFMNSLGSRITKLSLFQVALELVPATAATSVPLLDDIRAAATPAEVSDSSRSLLEQVQSAEPADFAVIALGRGEEWLTSRLFIAAVMMERMRGVKVLVFVEDTSNTARRFVAVAPVQQVRWALARRYPWLEAAWLNAAQNIISRGNAPNTISVNEQLILSDTGAIEPMRARNLVAEYIRLLQDSPPLGPAPDSGWLVLRNSQPERATWVTRELITSLLPPEAVIAWTDAFRDAPRAQRTRAILRRAGRFVALVDGDREFVRLVNRSALLEEVATSLSEEPEGSG